VAGRGQVKASGGRPCGCDPERFWQNVGLFGLREADAPTANGAGRGDDFRATADALGAGGAMGEDTAYVEAVGSLSALSSLQFTGLPILQDQLGGVLGIRSTTMGSAGQRTVGRARLV
jgi:hypothetical protein